MNYPQFFATLANQCQRFAPETEVPAEFTGALEEVRKASTLGDIYPPLLKAMTPLLGKRYADVLQEAAGDVGHEVNLSLIALDKERAAEQEKLLVAHQAFVAQEMEAKRVREAESQKLGEMQSRLVELENLVATLSAK